MHLKKFLKKLNEKKGATGGDVAVAVTLIIVTLGVVTAIYVNVNNKIKENVRYSNSVRIATQIVENIQSKNYDYFINYCNQVTDDNVYFKNVKGGNGEKIFEVNVPKGYSASIQSKKGSGHEVDIIRDVIVTVSYKIGGKTNTVSLSFIKEKEMLEQTNKPDISYINKNNYLNYYPIKYFNQRYYVTDEKDPEWYFYDPPNGDINSDTDIASLSENGSSYENSNKQSREISIIDGLWPWAYVLETSEELKLGDAVNITTISEDGNETFLENVNVYMWIPRFRS